MVNPGFLPVFLNLMNDPQKKHCLVRIGVALESSVDAFLIGNQKKNRLDYQFELEELLLDCTTYEKRIIFETVCSLKSSVVTY